jgi:hypothetical protein
MPVCFCGPLVYDTTKLLYLTIHMNQELYIYCADMLYMVKMGVECLLLLGAQKSFKRIPDGFMLFHTL